jgi:hypothetical protein
VEDVLGAELAVGVSDAIVGDVVIGAWVGDVLGAELAVGVLDAIVGDVVIGAWVGDVLGAELGFFVGVPLGAWLGHGVPKSTVTPVPNAPPVARTAPFLSVRVKMPSP